MSVRVNLSPRKGLRLGWRLQQSSSGGEGQRALLGGEQQCLPGNCGSLTAAALSCCTALL